MLVEAILHQAEIDLDLSVERDVATLRRRCKHEGFEFLTLTLPLLSDSLERGLEEGLLSCPPNFGRHGRLPRFLGGFFSRVFARNGELLDDACPDAVFFIRQICRFFKKPKDQCSDARNRDAIQHFVDVEGELRHMTSQVERKDIILDKISRIIWSQVFPEIDCYDLVCHHGPGVTADRLLPNGRHRIEQWNTRMEHLFPSDLHCYPNYEVAARIGLGIGGEIDCAGGPEFIELKDEQSVRIVLVPKTQTAPRVIAIEPSHVQYAQQSVKDYVYKVLETHSLTKRSIRFKRQDVNQRLAHSSSIDRRASTLDLKDASDRVHLHLVQRIFKNSGLLEYLEDARSLHATLPDGRNIVLFKYASMGSALCFPVEAMVFYTLIQSAMHQLDGRRPSSRSIRRYSRMIDIYGDDIIVPVEYADVVVRYLESYALKVNVNKSFTKGNFRESCGGDYFKGVKVNPIYARQVPYDTSRSWTPEHVMSWAATADLFYMRGMWHVAQTIRDMVSRVVRRPIPRTRLIGSGVAFFSYLFTTDLYYHEGLQCWKQKRLHYHPLKRKDSINGDELACLNKWGQHVYSRGHSPHSHGTITARYRGVHRSVLEGFGTELHDDTGRKFSTSSSSYPISYLGRRVQRVDEYSRTPVCDISIRGVPVIYDWKGQFISPLQSMAGTGDADGESSERVVNSARVEEFGFGSDYCLTEEVQSDPLRYLEGDTTGLDFDSSTKRGCFKSKSRWVTLAG
nr:MAG: hypothetical protein 3 [Leviviridae sp.]